MRANCLPHVSVAIRVNGNALHEHHADSEDGKTALCFVEAVSGAEFSIVLKIEAGYAYHNEDLQVRAFFDGNQARSTIIAPTQMTEGYTSSMDSTRRHIDGFNYYRKFTFAQHETTNNQPAQSLVRQLSKLGEVTVVLKRCRETGSTHGFNTTRPELTTLGAGGIPEKALKGRAISHHAQLGVERKRAGKNKNVHVEYPFGRDPIATYTFKYRSLDDLQADGIVRRSPSSVALEDRDPDDLTPQEASELIRRMRAEKELAANIKRDPGVKLEKPVKRQHSDMVGSGDENGHEDEEDLSITDIVTPGMKRARILSSADAAEVIDLTDD